MLGRVFLDVNFQTLPIITTIIIVNILLFIFIYKKVTRKK